VNSLIADSNEQALLKDWATDRWYTSGQTYSWGEKKYAAGNEPFVNQVWRSGKYVGFGVAQKAVVALYCPPGNVKAGFECNVCPSPGGCDTQLCPTANSVCSTTDGDAYSEISLNADEESVRIIAWVKKGQAF